MSWDECEIIDREVEYRLENWEENYEEKPEEDTVRADVCGMDFEYEWESLTEYLGEVLDKKNKDGYWKVKVENFGWRGLDGAKYIQADNGSEFLSKILPDCDCTFYIHNFGKGLAIQNFHHDSPTGREWYYIVPCSGNTYYDFTN